MTHLQAHILDSWVQAIRRAIVLGCDDAAYNLTRGLRVRMREVGMR